MMGRLFLTIHFQEVRNFRNVKPGICQNTMQRQLYLGQSKFGNMLSKNQTTYLLTVSDV